MLAKSRRKDKPIMATLEQKQCRQREARQAMNSLGRQEEIANGTVLLATDRSSFMTDAGWTLNEGAHAK